MTEHSESLQQAIFSNGQSLRYRVMQGETLESAREQQLASVRSQFSRYPDALAEQETALEEAMRIELAKREMVSYWRKAALRSGRPDWYGGADDNAKVWPALVSRLRRQGRTEDEIDSVDRDSTAVLSLSENPGLTRFSARGLVLGHVQSGKTGNMAAVIAKAADTPYKFFVVLSGMTDSLRNQTQARLDADVVNNGHRDRWHPWTQVDQVQPDGRILKGDFGHPASGGFPLAGPQCHIAVMKKNAAILRRFKRKLQETPAALLEQTPFLIIDDECDQASVNSARLRSSISATNRVIREILALLPRVAYIGYTATPFANILIDPTEEQDLYPRDFIHPLQRPGAYFGAEELFGREALRGETEDIDSGYDMIRLIKDDEFNSLRPAPRKSSEFEFEITASVGNAIRYFVMAVAARQVRGQAGEHSTMLIHTSVLNSVHTATKRAVDPYLTALSGAVSRGDGNVLRELEELWVAESARVPAGEFGLRHVEFGELVRHLAPTLESIDVKIENWRSSDRIDYSEPSRKYIVIGGNVLARGLTLSGLMVSFFMRSSSQYDTLMQMGRWFGYRKGYEDLPRIWMEEGVRDAFFDLATVEEEIRRDIAVYADENVKPSQFATRIRKIPGLAITANVKMRDAKTASIGYEGEHVQTIKFRRHAKTVLDDNWAAGHHLMCSAPDIEVVRGNLVGWQVDVVNVLAFLERYRMEEGRILKREYLADYIRQLAKEKAATCRWNVAVICGANGRQSDSALGPGGPVQCVTRSPMKGSGEVAFVKAIMSRADLFADMEVRPTNAGRMDWDEIKRQRERDGMSPLLLLYPIARDSAPATEKAAKTREAMDAVRDILGVGIVFPGDPSSGVVYVQANVQPEDADEVYEGEDAIPEELISVD